MTKSRAKNKMANEEKKRKEAAETIKAEVEKTEEVKTVSNNDAVKASKAKPASTNQAGRRQSVSGNVPSAQGAKGTQPAAGNVKPQPQASSISNLKKPSSTASQSGPVRTFERKEASYSAPTMNKPVNNKPKPTTPPAGAANKGTSTGSVTSAGLKTRVWVRDDD